MAYDVVVGVDTSEASRRAVELACRWHGSGLIRAVLLVHVVPWSPFSFQTPQDNELQHVHREQEKDAAREQILQPLADLARKFDVEPELIVRHGDGVHVLEEIAGEREDRMIIVGRTGDSGLRERLFGGLPAHLVKSSGVPVVVVP